MVFSNSVVGLQKNVDDTTHLWTMKIALVDHAMPLIRLLLILRKFRVAVVDIAISQVSAEHWEGTFVLDYRLSTRIDTVFKKMSRLYDVAKLSYGQGKNPQKFITLK